MINAYFTFGRFDKYFTVFSTPVQYWPQQWFMAVLLTACSSTPTNDAVTNQKLDNSIPRHKFDYQYRLSKRGRRILSR